MNTIQVEQNASVGGEAKQPESRNDQIVASLLRENSGKVSIRALLIAKGLRQKTIAKKYGIGESEVSRVINRVEKTLHIRQKIAIELELPFHLLWSEET